MSEWIEFNEIQNNSEVRPIALRCYNIEAVRKTGDNSCRLCTDAEHGHFIDVANSYIKVMEKIRKAEGPITVPVAEHFTTEEYEYLVQVLENDVTFCKDQQVILGKLKEILKEDE